MLTHSCSVQRASCHPLFMKGIDNGEASGRSFTANIQTDCLTRAQCTVDHA